MATIRAMRTIPAIERATARRVLVLVLAGALFPLSVHVLQVGAGAVAAPLRAALGPRSPIALLGLGWLGSILTLSGSPTASAALALLDRSVLSESQCLATVIGTRLRAMLSLVFLALLYSARRGPAPAAGALAFLTPPRALRLSPP